MKFAKNCVFLVDSAIEISIALGKFLEIPPRGLRPLGGISKNFPRARKISWRIPSKKRNFLHKFPQKIKIFGTNSEFPQKPMGISPEFSDEFPLERAI